MPFHVDTPDPEPGFRWSEHLGSSAIAAFFVMLIAFIGQFVLEYLIARNFMLLSEAYQASGTASGPSLLQELLVSLFAIGVLHAIVLYVALRHQVRTGRLSGYDQKVQYMVLTIILAYVFLFLVNGVVLGVWGLPNIGLLIWVFAFLVPLLVKDAEPVG